MSPLTENQTKTILGDVNNGSSNGIINSGFVPDSNVDNPQQTQRVAKEAPQTDTTLYSQQEEVPEKTFRRALPQLLACSAKNMILLSYGMSLGFVTIAIPALSASTNGTSADSSIALNTGQISWFGSINWIMVAVGGIVSGPFATPWGRKPAMIAVNFLFLAGYVVFNLAESVPVLYFAQALCGFGGGLLEAPVLTYIAEISEPHLRGALSASTTAVLILGLFIDFALGSVLSWRSVALVNLCAPVMAVISLFFVPESPHWLIGKGREQEAERALCWLRGWVQPEVVRQEMSLLMRTLSPKSKDSTKRPSALPSVKQLSRKTFLVPYALVVYCFFVGHWSGMTPLQTFAVTIFSTVGTPIDKYYATVLIGLVELAGCLVCVGLVHYTGKRPLAIVSTLGIGLCFLIVATYSHIHGVVDPTQVITTSQSTYAWLPMVLLVTSAFISHIGIRILPWVLIGEVFTPEVKGFASGASGCMGYLVGFTANKSFNFLQEQLTLPGTFWLYSGIAISGTVLLYFFLPETEGRPLHEILEHFEGTRNLTIICKKDSTDAENSRQNREVESRL